MDSQELASEISVVELKKALDEGKKPVILDVREPRELSICRLEYTLHIPLGELRFRLDELNQYKDQLIVVYCRSGKRSQMAVEFMREEGYPTATNLKGGVLAWSDEIDSTFQKY